MKDNIPMLMHQIENCQSGPRIMRLVAITLRAINTDIKTFCKEMGMSYTTYRRWIRNERSPRLGSRQRLVEGLRDVLGAQALKA